MDSPITRAEHNEFVKRCEDEHKRIGARLSELEKANVDNNKLLANVEKMAVNMEYMFKELQKQGQRLDILEELPNKGWNTLKNGVFNAIGAAIGGGVIAAIIYLITVIN